MLFYLRKHEAVIMYLANSQSSFNIFLVNLHLTHWFIACLPLDKESNTTGKLQAKATHSFNYKQLFMKLFGWFF